jgi:hypothetical protein
MRTSDEKDAIPPDPGVVGVFQHDAGRLGREVEQPHSTELTSQRAPVFVIESTGPARQHVRQAVGVHLAQELRFSSGFGKTQHPSPLQITDVDRAIVAPDRPGRRLDVAEDLQPVAVEVDANELVVGHEPHRRFER